MSLIALSMAVHGTGLVLVALLLQRLVLERQREGLTSHRVVTKIIVLVCTVGLLLAALHVVEAGLWAGAYWWLGAISSPADAILYSVDSIATRGSSGVVLEGHWQMMGALEAVDGMLLFGISTAFIFSFMHRYWAILYPSGQVDP